MSANADRYIFQPSLNSSIARCIILCDNLVSRLTNFLCVLISKAKHMKRKNSRVNMSDGCKVNRNKRNEMTQKDQGDTFNGAANVNDFPVNFIISPPSFFRSRATLRSKNWV